MRAMHRLQGAPMFSIYALFPRRFVLMKGNTLAICTIFIYNLIIIKGIDWAFFHGTFLGIGPYLDICDLFVCRIRELFIGMCYFPDSINIITPISEMNQRGIAHMSTNIPLHLGYYILCEVWDKHPVNGPEKRHFRCTYSSLSTFWNTFKTCSVSKVDVTNARDIPYIRSSGEHIKPFSR